MHYFGDRCTAQDWHVGGAIQYVNPLKNVGNLCCTSDEIKSDEGYYKRVIDVCDIIRSIIDIIMSLNILVL